MIILYYRRGWGRRNVLGAWGRGLERFLKGKMKGEAQAFGHHNFAKGGICRSIIEPRALPKSTRAREKRCWLCCLLLHYFSAIFWKPISVIIPASHQGMEFSSLRAGIIGAQTGENVICFSCLFYSKTTEWVS